MADWLIAGEYKFTFRYQKSKKARNIAVCAHADCPFRMYAATNKDSDMVKAIAVNPNHIYIRAMIQPL